MADSFISSYIADTVPNTESFDSSEKIKTSSIDKNISENIEPPFSKYSEIKGKPYTVDYLDIEFWDALTPELDTDGMIKTVAEIENYVKAEIKEKGFEDTIASYKEIMDKVKSAVNINSNEKSENKIDRIKKFIDLTLRVKKADKKKDKLINELRALHG